MGKTHPRIVFAAVFGMVLVLGALLHARAPLVYERAGDGALRAETARTATLKTLSEAREARNQNAGESDATYTAQLAISAFKELTVDGADPKTAASNTTRSLLGAMSDDMSGFSPTDITTTPMTPRERRAYGNAVADIILSEKASANGKNEFAIFIDAVEAGDARMLSDIAPIAASYETMVAKLLHLPAPHKHQEAHYVLLNALDAVANDIRAMEDAFEDPVYALVRVKRYGNDVFNLQQAIETLYSELYSSGITFDESDSTRALISPTPTN